MPINSHQLDLWWLHAPKPQDVCRLVCLQDEISQRWKFINLTNTRSCKYRLINCMGVCVILIIWHCLQLGTGNIDDVIFPQKIINLDPVAKKESLRWMTCSYLLLFRRTSPGFCPDSQSWMWFPSQPFFFCLNVVQRPSGFLTLELNARWMCWPGDDCAYKLLCLSWYKVKSQTRSSKRWVTNLMGVSANAGDISVRINKMTNWDLLPEESWGSYLLSCSLFSRISRSLAWFLKLDSVLLPSRLFFFLCVLLITAWKSSKGQRLLDTLWIPDELVGLIVLWGHVPTDSTAVRQLTAAAAVESSRDQLSHIWGTDSELPPSRSKIINRSNIPLHPDSASRTHLWQEGVKTHLTVRHW